MATAETAKLIAQLTLDDRMSKGLATADKNVGALESSLGRAQRGAATFAKNGALIAAGAVGVLAVSVKSGLADLATLENAVSSVDGAIKQFGFSGQITGKEVAGWANEIEASVQAAFDDKDITQAATTLIRFGKVTPKNLKAALTVMTDLAAKTGDVESAGTLLAKSLADPAKAAGKLAKNGIILTKAQQDTIKAMLKQNDVAGAQQVVLDAVGKATHGAAAAMAGPYQDALNKTRDATEDARKALAVGFLPVIIRVADKLSKIVADPKALASIQKFGEGLAGGLDSLISIAERLPWQTIGDSLQLAGAGAKAVLNAFVALPPWVQTAVLTGWGLNKLTGGALTGIVGELAKGLVKGVLGINAANVTINAANVIGGGGGVPGGLSKGDRLLTGISSLVTKVAIVGIAAEAADVLHSAISPGGGLPGRIAGGTQLPTDQLQWPFGPKNTPKVDFGPFQNILGGDSGISKPVVDAIKQTDGEAARRQNATNERLEAIKGFAATSAAATTQAKADVVAATQAAAASTVHATERQEATNAQKLTELNAQVAAASALAAGDSRAEQSRIAAAENASRTAGAVAAAASQATAAAVRAKDLSVKVFNETFVKTSISISDVAKAQHHVNSIFRVAS